MCSETEGTRSAPARDTAGRRREPREQGPEALTSREIEILNLIFSGRASSEVAELLCVSKRTIDFHLGKAYAKLGVRNRVQAFKKASELGIIQS